MSVCAREPCCEVRAFAESVVENEEEPLYSGRYRLQYYNASKRGRLLVSVVAGGVLLLCVCCDIVCLVGLLVEDFGSV